MAPTETLAEQHFATLQKLMPASCCRPRSSRARRRRSGAPTCSASCRAAELRLLVGTHALIESAVTFDRLAVAVVDEQHRFGVNQRRALDRKAPDGSPRTCCT
jgi:ATP-dependent DNA helicase RecG